MEWAAVATLFVMVAAILVWPLWRHPEYPLPAGNGLEDADQERMDEKKRLLANLRALRLDFAESRVTEADFRAQENEYETQIAALLAPPASAGMTQPPPRPVFTRAGSLILVCFLAAVSFLLFAHGRQPAPATQQTPDIDAMVARLEARLAANPDDIAGQIMMARSYASLGRAPDALKAWRKALELEPGNSEAQAGLALLLLQSGDENAVREALKQIEQLRRTEPEEPVWLWYQAMSLNLLGRQAEAKITLEKMLPMLPPESGNAEMVREALRQLGR